MSGGKFMKKSEEVHEVICRLFARKGYHATSVRDIGRELNMNKSSLYYYIGSKEGALFKIINDRMDYAVENLVEIVAKELPPEDKLIEVLDFYTRHYCRDPEGLTLLINEFHFLEKDHRLILVEKQKHILKLLNSILKELAQKGSFKSIDPTVAIFAFLGMAHYTVKWYDRDGPVGVDELASTFVEIFTRGILR